jgi:chemotaxis-related protein WspD
VKKPELYPIKLTKPSASDAGGFSARQLLERQAEESYTEEWTDLLAKQKIEEEVTTETSIVIFRLVNEWLAISTAIFSEVAQVRTLHRIPHRKESILLGMVNLRGQLTLCVNMQNLLEIESPATSESYKKPQLGDTAYKRMLAIQQEQENWIFPVDEVYGIFHCEVSRLENVPVTIAKSTANYLKGVISWNNRSVGYLDEGLLFYSLRRSIV